MSQRRITDPGRREREARKRHRRASLWCVEWGAEAGSLKLGREHYRRWVRRDICLWLMSKGLGCVSVMSLPAERTRLDSVRR